MGAVHKALDGDLVAHGRQAKAVLLIVLLEGTVAGVDDHRLGKPLDHLVRGEVGGAVGIFQNLVVPVGVQL